MIGAVSAANETDIVMSEEIADTQAVPQEDVLEDTSSEGVLEDSSSEEQLSSPEPIKTSIVAESTNVVRNDYFSVKLTDEKGAGIANKTVQFYTIDKTFNKKTDDNGIAKLKYTVKPGTYSVKFSFKADGYVSSENSTDVFVIPTSTSTIKASGSTAYVGFKNIYTFTLTAGDTPLPGRKITFNINGKTITKKTNSKGVAKLEINEPKGKYSLTYSYAGEDNINPASGKVKVTVKKGMSVKIYRENSVTYNHKKVGYFKIKLVDARGDRVKSKKVVFKVAGKKFTKRTNSKGVATLKIKLSAGTYKIKISSSKTSKYNYVSRYINIKVNPKHISENGMWLFGRDMNAVNLKTLQKNGFKHIFLNFAALDLYGKSGVEKWIKSANAHGLKVHIWMQAFYEGDWYNPVTNPGIINKKVNEAVRYAKIKGVAGIHMDYVRFPGTASHYSGSVNAVNNFVKKAATQIHKVNKKLIVSAAVMPEPSAMKSAYGQDISTMGKYLDAIVPMVYKGNYGAGSGWIKSVTQTFAKQSKAPIWTGLQSYHSDSNTGKLSVGELKGDARAAASGGAKGVILFRFGLFSNINFNEV